MKTFLSKKYCLLSCFLISTVFAGVCQPSVREYKNPTGAEFPIVAWSTFRTANSITDANFRTIREGGFNISLALVPDMQLTYQSLECAEKAGIKVMVNCPQTKKLDLIPTNVSKLRNNKTVMGYYVTDEPTAKKFPELKKICDAIYKYDPNHFPFINLLPIVEPSRLDATSYKDYLLQFIKTVGLPLFSFDNYPIVKTNGKVKVRDNFYENLEIASAVTKETGVPFWAFCMSTPHFSFPTPTKGDLMFEAFSALAYGAQGLSYYTYCQETDQTIKYYGAPINTKGQKTDIWYLCKDVNTQIQALSKVFLGAKLQKAWHTGRKIPTGATKLGKLPAPFSSLKTENTGVLVSHLKNGNAQYLVIVSHDPVKSQKITIVKEDTVKRVMSDGNIVDDNNTAYTLEPGGYLIFNW